MTRLVSPRFLPVLLLASVVSLTSLAAPARPPPPPPPAHPLPRRPYPPTTTTGASEDQPGQEETMPSTNVTS